MTSSSEGRFEGVVDGQRSCEVGHGVGEVDGEDADAHLDEALVALDREVVALDRTGPVAPMHLEHDETGEDTFAFICAAAAVEHEVARRPGC